MAKSWWTVARYQLSKVPPVTKVDLTGQTVVVVGANTGIGFEAAKHFASMNPGKLILACRSEEKGKNAVSRIKAEAGFDRLELRLLDLGKFASVTAFADTFQNEERLDILVMNAGVAAPEYRVTPDGWEETIQVNALSTSLTTLLLLPKLVQTGQTYNTHPRIVIVASDLHYFGVIPPSALDSPDGPFKSLSADASPSRKGLRYLESKLVNVFFTRSLAQRLSSTPVIVNAVNPGYCVSDMRRDIGGFEKRLHALLEKVFAWTAEEGSRQLVWAAVGGREAVDKLRGAYINTMKVEEPAEVVRGEKGKERGEKIWADLIRILSEADGRVAGIVQQYSK